MIEHIDSYNLTGQEPYSPTMNRMTNYLTPSSVTTKV